MLTQEQVLFAASIAESYPAGLPMTAWGHDGNGEAVVNEWGDGVPVGCG